MANEKKSFFKKIVVTAKKVYSFLNKDIRKSKKSKQTKHDDIKIKEEERINSTPKEKENAKNVFDIIDESSKETVDKEVKAIEEELIPQPEEIEAKTPKLEDEALDEIELEVAQVDSSEPEADQTESQIEQETKNKKQSSVEALQKQEVTDTVVQEIKDDVVESSETIQELDQDDDVQKESSEIAEPEQDLTTISTDVQDLETVDLNSDLKFKSIIRPDSVLSYLDDIVMQQEKQKNKNKIQKVYKKNKDSHVIMPD